MHNLYKYRRENKKRPASSRYAAVAGMKHNTIKDTIFVGNDFYRVDVASTPLVDCADLYINVQKEVYHINRCRGSVDFFNYKAKGTGRYE